MAANYQGEKVFRLIERIEKINDQEKLLVAAGHHLITSALGDTPANAQSVYHLINSDKSLGRSLWHLMGLVQERQQKREQLLSVNIYGENYCLARLLHDGTQRAV